MPVPPRTPRLRGRVRDCKKVHSVGFGLLVPSANHATRSTHFSRRNDVYLGSRNALTFSSFTDPAKAVTRVEKDVRLLRCRIGESIDRGAPRLSNLRAHTVALQCHAIISNGS